MSTHASFTLDVQDGIARVHFTQGDRGNPFDAAACAELAEVITGCEVDPEVRCVLIQATGRFFSVGGDLASLGRSREELTPFIKRATIGLHAAISRMSRMDAPVVVAVHGLAAGGGVSLAAAADFCLAARSAKFYAAYQGIGLTVDGGGSYFVPRRVGTRRATSFFLRNQTWDAETAVRHGLADEVVDDDRLEAEALALATELAAGPTRAFGEVKNLLLSSLDTPLETQLELEAQAMARAGATEDAWEGVSAVAAKRRPGFAGR